MEQAANANPQAEAIHLGEGQGQRETHTLLTGIASACGFAFVSPLTRKRQATKPDLRRLSFLVVLIGVVWRLTRYLLRFPVWGDEAMLLVNYPGRGYLDLAGPLDNCQVAPLLFHWAELTALRLFGTSELAVRLPPLLASLASLPLFWRLARLTLPSRQARLLAVCVLAVSIWPATLGSLVKPYTFDLFFSLLILVCAAEWHRRPQRLRWLGALALSVPVALVASYPAVFVAAAACLALLPAVWRQKRAVTWAVYLLVGVLSVTTFAGHYLFVGKAQLGSSVRGSTTAQEMRSYWEHGFPPRDPSALPLWLLSAHTGQMAAHPLGAASGGSVVTVAFCLVGAWRLWRRRRWLLGLFATIFLLGLVAAALRGYPYGASCRLAQHLAPVYCLLAGLGLSAVLARRPRALLVAFVVLATIGVGGIVRDFVKPYRDDESRWAAGLVADLEARAGEEPIFVRMAPNETSPVLHWQLLRRGGRVRWLRDDDPPCGSAAWLLSEDSRTITGWRRVQRTPATLVPSRPREPIRPAVVERWVRLRE